MTTTLLLAMTMATAAQAQISTPAPAPTAQIDARFSHWLGCWRLEDDLVGTGARVCVTPEKDGVRLQTLVGRQRGTDEVILADGVARPVAESDCKGTERSEWSKDGLRIFRQIDATCGKEATKVSSVIFLTDGPTWVSVQHVDAPVRSVRIQRYRRAIDQKLADGSRSPAASAQMLKQAAPINDNPWSVDDVIEANSKLPADAVQAALSEYREPFNLDKNGLVALANAKVPETVIDLMVALTYPKRFVVQRASAGASLPPSGVSMGGGWYDPFMSPMAYSAMSSCFAYSALSTLYGPCSYMFSPYASSYYNSYYGYNRFNNFGYGYDYNYGNSWVPTGIAENPGTTGSGDGRAINGRGYTQVRTREAEPSPIRSGNVGNGGGYSGGSSSGSSGGSSGVSSQGYSGGSSSSGSSSGGGDRTAVSRPPGGGE